MKRQQAAVAVVVAIAVVASGFHLRESLRWTGVALAEAVSPRSAAQAAPRQAVVETTAGTFVIDLAQDAAPNQTAYFMKLSPVVPIDWVFIGLVICSIVGIVFGTYPAFKAANLDPIESLRYE